MSFEYKPKFECGVCMDLVELHPQGVKCDVFGAAACRAIDVDSVIAQGGCVAAGHCAPFSENADELVAGGMAGSSVPDVRVTKGFGTKDYGLVRVSVITQEAPDYAASFDYSGQFEHRWKDNYISTSMVKVSESASTVFSFGNHSVGLQIPAQGAGVSGILLGDPCFVSNTSGAGLVGCQYGGRFNTRERTPALLNTFMKDPRLDYWAVLGDNFYDRTGRRTKEFFSALDATTKQKIMLTVPGNHDYAVLGSPAIGTGADQWANGFIQFYAQDTKAAQDVGLTAAGRSPFDLSVNPDTLLPIGGHFPNIENTFSYNQVGNVGFISFSGAYSYVETAPYFAEACAWARDEPSVKVVMLLGHWDVQGLGAASDMTVPSVYDEISKIEGCDRFADQSRLKFFMGHTHCNVPHPHNHVDKGFMVAGQGMEGCGNYGIVVASTVAERIRVVHFPVQSLTSADSYHNVTSCVESRGWEACADDHAEVWLDQEL